MDGGLADHCPSAHFCSLQHTRVYFTICSPVYLKKMGKENHLNVHPIGFTKIYTFTGKRNLSLMDCMNKHFHVTMPLTYDTLASVPTGTHWVSHKVTNAADYLANVDNNQ